MFEKLQKIEKLLQELNYRNIEILEDELSVICPCRKLNDDEVDEFEDDFEFLIYYKLKISTDVTVDTEENMLQISLVD